MTVPQVNHHPQQHYTTRSTRRTAANSIQHVINKLRSKPTLAIGCFVLICICTMQLLWSPSPSFSTISQRRSVAKQQEEDELLEARHESPPTNSGNNKNKEQQRQERKEDRTTNTGGGKPQPLPPQPPLKPNLLWIVTDQQRFDTLGIIQRRMSQYDNKLQIHTPNIDKLARRGVLFETAYCMSPSCAPARAVLRTGCSLQRTGLMRNKLANENIYKRMDFVKDKVENLVTFEQILADELGYKVETYGKWHAPYKFFYSKKHTLAASAKAGRPIPRKAIQKNQYDFYRGQPLFVRSQIVKPWYRKNLKQLMKLDGFSPAQQCPLDGKGQPDTPYKPGQQQFHWSKCPYDPISMDPRHGAPKQTPLNEEAGYTKWQIQGENTSGRDSLSERYTVTGTIGFSAYKALSRSIAWAKNKRIPFSIAVHFSGPHPPIVSPARTMDHYYEKRTNMFISPSIKDPMKNSAYADINGRFRITDPKYGWDDIEKVQESQAAYYGMIEEIDTWIGKYLDRLHEYSLLANTMIVFTSDHGEMMGAHGMRNKFNFLEEAVRIPMMISFPGRITPNQVVTQHVSHLDLHSTILDYLGAKRFDKSDGKSLRRFIEGKSFNKFYDEHTVVCELDERVPVDSTSFDGELGAIPNFMIRKDNMKLMLPKKRDSPVMDMMYDLDNDPFEMNNLLGTNAASASEEIIGKAEHLKCLLWEWMNRMDDGDWDPEDGTESKRYYSDPKWNLGVGEGDKSEILRRRTWPARDYWQSHMKEIEFGPRVFNQGKYQRAEYLYIGRSSPNGALELRSLQVLGPDAQHFDVSVDRDTAPSYWWIRIRILFRSPFDLSIKDMDAHIEIKTDLDRVRMVKITSST